MGEKLFGESFYEKRQYDSQHELLSTIRVPKNLLYLTDRLPQPSYDQMSTVNKQNKLTQSTIIKQDSQDRLLDQTSQDSQMLEREIPVRKPIKHHSKKRKVAQDDMASP